MRYAKATDDFYVPEPDDVRSQVGKPGAYSFEPVEPDVAATTREEMRAIYEAAFSAYERLVEQGVARARALGAAGRRLHRVLLDGERAGAHELPLAAQLGDGPAEIRRYAEACEQFLADKMPVTYASFVANDRTAP